ncbi:LysR family transcriptional regulator [Paraburkholderia eburnea]|uniref:LysR family transcriptional regulator n=1 Tax=Paraburkholderia eburnea TaxID=1189126 RepID=A0A2S4MC01_9BURK|nr:LysR family transcriptional regulator [Paraburkholderia eburnea]POR52263.1 LysR family transcriptional regulator [Paraburkholderia eburnea]PRZ23154.1 LysR family transcriptional regulator [Paraburkholderia eburnea]
METRDLDYLLAIEKHGGIGKAAEALGMSQPALTKAIQRVEAQAGLALFERTANGVVPTPPGALFLARARRIALEYEDALKEMHAIRGGEQGMLRIGYSPTVPDTLVLDACRQLLKERPAARLRLRRRLARELVDLLVAGELDLIVAPEQDGDNGELSFVELFCDTLSVLAADTHPLHRKRNLRLVNLVDQEWLLPGPTIPLRQKIDAAFERQGLPAPRLRVETDFGSISLLHLMRDTTMLCVAGTESFGTLEGLRALNVDTKELDLYRHIGVIFRTQAYLSPLAQRTIVLLQERAS